MAVCSAVGRCSSTLPLLLIHIPSRTPSLALPFPRPAPTPTPPSTPLYQVGQLFIFYTIKRYGPLVFATIQTVRQLLSIVLSILFFAHPLNAMEVLGIGIVFTTLGGQILSKYLANRASAAAQAARPMLPIAGQPRDAESPTEAESGLASPADGVPDDGKPLLRG